MLLAYLMAGLLLGGAYFQTGRWTTECLVSGRATLVTASMIVARFLSLAAALTLISLQGAMPLLITALGVFIARAAVLRRASVPA